MKKNIVLKLYFVSLKNASDPELVEVPSVCKHGRFTHEYEASSSRSKNFNPMLDLSMSNVTPHHLESIDEVVAVSCNVCHP